jgi:hypothetical protein
MSKPKRQHWVPCFLPPALRDAGYPAQPGAQSEGVVYATRVCLVPVKLDAGPSDG